MSKRFCVIPLAVVIIFGAAEVDGATLGTSQFRTVALIGQTSPLLGDSAEFVHFTEPFLTADGRVVFYGSAYAPLLADTQLNGIWREETKGSLALIARQHAPAPGIESGSTFIDFGSIDVNSRGEVAFSARWDLPSRGVWTESGGNGLRLIHKVGDVVGGIATVSMLSDSVRITDTGVTSFNQRVGPEPLRRSIWIDKPGAGLQLVAMNGDQGPSLPTGVVLSDVLYPHPSSGGDLVYYGHVSGPGVNHTNDFGLWNIDPNGQSRLVVREGAIAAGFGSNGPRYTGEMYPIVNDNRQVAFTSELVSASGLTEGIWKGNLGGRRDVSLVAASGLHAPGEPAENVFSSFFFPAFNNRYHTAFAARVAGPDIPSSEIGLWSEAGQNGLHAVARHGQQAVGFESGVTYESFSEPLLNDHDYLVFAASTTAVNNRAGLYVEDPDGTVRLLLRTGDELDVDGSSAIDLRTVQSFRFSTADGHTHQPSPFNNLGELALRISFSDDSEGLFVLNVLPVPEPGSWMMVITAAAMLIGASRRSLTTRYPLTLDVHAEGR